MDLVDDQGRLFGLVNVIDALTVLLVAAVVVAGVALVTQPEPEPPAPPDTATRQVTLDLGTQPDYLVERIQPGDTYSPSGDSNLTVTDIYLAPEEGNARGILSVELEAPVSKATIVYDGAPPRLGRELTIQTDTYQVTGTIRDVGGDIPRRTTDVLINATVDATTSDAIQPGGVYTLAGHKIATVESVEAYGTSDPDRRRIFLGLSIDTVDFGNAPQFGGRVVRPGETIHLRTDAYDLTGEIRRVGATELEGEPATRPVTLSIENVRPHVADSLEAGMTETVAGETVATITSVETGPAMVVVTSQDGQIFHREHPTDEDVTIEAELRVRETATGTTFKGEPLQRGSTVVLDLGTVTVETTVDSF